MANTLERTTLRGPADGDEFRVDIRGARWYHDPLPGCDIAVAAPTETYPAVTTVKKAWSKPFRKKLETGETVPLDAFRAAEFAVGHRDAIAQLDDAAAISLIATSAARALGKAADRGSSIHAVMEGYAAGREPNPLDLVDDAAPFLPAARAFVEECTPRWHLSEVVVFNRTVGYGGTFDAALEIDGQLYAVDFKTRGGNHGAYEEDACQIAAYAHGEYCIIDDGSGRARRQRLPEFAAGLVVSLTVEGYRLFPIDLALGWSGFRDMRVCWEHKREGGKSGRAAVGKPIVLGHRANGSTAEQASPTAEPTTASPKTAVEPCTPERRAWITQRVRVIAETIGGGITPVPWPAEIPTLKAAASHDDTQVDAIAKWCDDVEARLDIPFGDRDPADPFAAFEVKPDGAVGPVLGAEVAQLIATLQALPGDLLAEVEAITARERVPNLRSGTATREQIEMVQALVAPRAQLADERLSWVRGHLTEHKVDDDLVPLLVRAASLGKHSIDQLTEADIDRLEALIAAFDLGVVDWNDEPGKGLVLIAGPESEAVLLERYGDRKSILDAAKRVAPELNILRPTSAAKAAQKPVLAAVLAAKAAPSTPDAA